MTNCPLVSIVIPVYNGADYLREAVESALSQTYKNVEIIVVNDGSNDDGETESVALSYGEKIRYFHKENGGVSSALNYGISQMKGEYFSWLSHDDKYTSDKVEAQVALMSKYRDKKVVALCGSTFIDKNSNLIELHNPKRFENEFNHWKDGLENLFKYGTYNGCAFLIPKTLFDECGYFDEKLRFSQDTLMWAKVLLAQYCIIYDERIGVLSRVHGNQQTHKSRHLLEHDSLVIAKYLAPQLADLEHCQALYLFAKRNAKLSHKYVVNLCVQTGKITFLKRLKLCAFLIYGKIRPLVRKIYYKLRHNVKTY